MNTAFLQLASTLILPEQPRGPSEISVACRSIEQGSEVAYLVSDCPALQEAFSRSLKNTGVIGVVFRTIEEYLGCTRTDQCSCLILDIHFPDKDGLHQQCKLAKEASPPVAFIIGRDDIPSAVRVMKAGAIEVLTKPVNQGSLIEAIQTAFARDRKLRQTRAELSTLQERYSHLTPRQREVFCLIAGGLLNKQAAGVLGIAQVTLQVHRGQIMRQMKADSFADLVRMAEKLGISFSNDSKFRPNRQKDRHVPQR